MLFEGCCDIEIFLCYRHTLTSDINGFRIFAKLTLFITPAYSDKKSKYGNGQTIQRIWTSDFFQLKTMVTGSSTLHNTLSSGVHYL